MPRRKANATESQQLAIPDSPVLQKLMLEFCEQLISCNIRPIHQWVTDEIVLPPPGPREHQRYSFEFQPVHELILREIDSGKWSEIFLVGPSQSGKTLCCFCIPVLYFTCELSEPIIVGIPDQAMADDKFKVDLLPPLESSPNLSTFIPDSGPGSRGGKVKDIFTLSSGVRIRIMSKGGNDQRRAGYTSRVVIVTEAAGWSEAAEGSKEANPLAQLQARQESFPTDERLLIVEGTVQESTNLPWSARHDSTCTQIVSECPHCGEFVSPEREHLVGWREAKSSGEAYQLAHWQCPACDEAISDDQRREMVAEAVLLHAGQFIDDTGNVAGEAIDTQRLWLRYSAWHNLFAETGALAVKEWRLAQIDADSPEYQDALKALLQFTWASPYEAVLALETEPLTISDVAAHQGAIDYPRGIVPPDTTHLVFGADLGMRVGWYVVAAGTAQRLIHIVDYSPFEINGSEEEMFAAFFESLKGLHDQMNKGYSLNGGGVMVPRFGIVDSSWMQEEAITAMHRIAGRKRHAYLLPVFGRGTGQYGQMKVYQAPVKIGGGVIEIGNKWHMKLNKKRRSFDIFADVDFWKQKAQQAYKLPRAARGSISLFAGPDAVHKTFRRHMVNESINIVVEQNKGAKKKYLRSGDQHYLDALVYALVGLDRAGFRTYEIPEEELRGRTGRRSRADLMPHSV